MTAFKCLFCGMQTHGFGTVSHRKVCEGRHPAERHEAHIQQVINHIQRVNRSSTMVYPHGKIRMIAEEEVGRDYRTGKRWREPPDSDKS